MAVGIHIVRVAFLKVDGAGTVIDKNSPETTLKGHLTGSHEHRVIPDSNIPNSASYPTVKAYLDAEALDEYVLQYLDQNTVITYLRDNNAGFPEP
jgi:hypothetical protein